MSAEDVVLVTGGAGYVGSHACKALAQAGMQPVVYDNLVYGHREHVQWGPLEIGDIADRGRLDAVLQHYRPSAVMHFAAYTYIGESITDPAKFYRNNVAGSLTLLEAVRDQGIPHVVFSSTCAIYGTPERTPIAEDAPQRPFSPYGTSKLMVEQMLRDFDAAYGIKSVCLRYFNAAGADPDGTIGENHQPETHLLPLVLQTALGQRPLIEIFGDDYPTPDGTCIRDYIHVCDLADAHVRSLRYLKEQGRSAVFNLGNGKGFSVLQIIDAARQISGRPIATQISPRRAGDPAVLLANAELARQQLGWIPRFPELTTILEHAWRWHQAQAGQH